MPFERASAAVTTYDCFDDTYYSARLHHYTRVYSDLCTNTAQLSVQFEHVRPTYTCKFELEIYTEEMGHSTRK